MLLRSMIETTTRERDRCRNNPSCKAYTTVLSDGFAGKTEREQSPRKCLTTNKNFLNENVSSRPLVREGSTRVSTKFKPMSPTRPRDGTPSPNDEDSYRQGTSEEPYDPFPPSYEWSGRPRVLNVKKPGDGKKSEPRDTRMKAETEVRAKATTSRGKKMAEIFLQRRGEHDEAKHDEPHEKRRKFPVRIYWWEEETISKLENRQHMPTGK